MRARSVALVTILLAAGCGPANPMLGTWRFSLTAAISTAAGPVRKQVTFDLDLASTASADLVGWRIGGGCNVAVPLSGKVASLDAKPPLCSLSAGAQITLIGETGTTVKAGDQLGVNTARFEALDDGRLGASFDYKLYTDLRDARVGPAVAVTTTAANHGTRVK